MAIDMGGPFNKAAYVFGTASIAAGNYDISDIFVDVTFKILGRDYKKLIDFFNELNKLSEKHNVNIWFTLSCNKEELPPLIFNYGENVNS